MIDTLFSTTALAIVIGISLLVPESASASSLRLLTEAELLNTGSYEKINQRSPGTYGIEVRGGYDNPARTWELGVGTHTSNRGTFNEGHINWGVDNDNIFDFSINWELGSQVTATIGDKVVSYDADWVMGNALQFIVKRNSYLFIEEVDGTLFNYTVDQLVDSDYTKIFITGDSLKDGWDMTGKIRVTPGGGSRNEVLVKVGNFTSVPEPSTIFGSLVALALGFRLRKAN